MFMTHTGSACDETLNNNVNGGSRMYIAGNLCLNNGVGLSPSALIVGGNLSLQQQRPRSARARACRPASRPTSAAPARWTKGSTANPCTGNQDVEQHLLEAEPAELRRGRQPQPDAHEHADDRLPRLVHERDPGAGPELHDHERYTADVRLELSEPRQQPRPAEPHTRDVVHLPGRSRRIDDAEQRDHVDRDVDHRRRPRPAFRPRASGSASTAST